MLMTLILIFILQFSSITGNVIAQNLQVDYAKQVMALQKSFADKNVDFLKPYVSEELTFGPIPATNTMVVLTQVVNNFPKANLIEIKGSESGKVLIKYDFQGLGKSESYIYFNEKGQITEIELIENIILEQIKAQQALANSVQAPVPGDLEETYVGNKVVFQAKDGVEITAMLYEVNPKSPTILLCHQAGYNKFEYADIAPRLNQLGYNCLAMDQRSGGSFANHENETLLSANAKGHKDISMIDAEQDITAAVEYLNKQYKQKIIVWGSSYSSSLVLFAAQENKHIKAVISFSPGDYFGDKKTSLKEVIPTIKKPFFLTSSKAEAEKLSELVQGVALKKNQVQFIPESDGFHGSRAIWVGQKGADEYWNALKGFLASIK